MATKDPITCHVLDTTTGRPAAGIAVLLVCKGNPVGWQATTNSDGRVAKWETVIPNQISIEEEIRQQAVKGGNETVPEGSSVWKLAFSTGSYYGLGKTFFPVVELSFVVKEGEHFHVPLLLGPYSYTTYRGS